MLLAQVSRKLRILQNKNWNTFDLGFQIETTPRIATVTLGADLARQGTAENSPKTAMTLLTKKSPSTMITVMASRSQIAFVPYRPIISHRRRQVFPTCSAPQRTISALLAAGIGLSSESGSGEQQRWSAWLPILNAKAMATVPISNLPQT